MSLLLIGLAPAVSADSLSVCYNYDCLAEAEVNYGAEQLTRVRDLLGVARNAAEERERLSLAIGWLLGWAGEQTPIAADRGGNFADDGSRPENPGSGRSLIASPRRSHPF